MNPHNDGKATQWFQQA